MALVSVDGQKCDKMDTTQNVTQGTTLMMQLIGYNLPDGTAWGQRMRENVSLGQCDGGGHRFILGGIHPKKIKLLLDASGNFLAIYYQ